MMRFIQLFATRCEATNLIYTIWSVIRIKDKNPEILFAHVCVHRSIRALCVRIRAYVVYTYVCVSQMPSLLPLRYVYTLTGICAAHTYVCHLCNAYVRMPSWLPLRYVYTLAVSRLLS